MGNSNSRKTPPVIATCKAPMYCINEIGGRHLLIGGGGGAAKTGVINQIESHLLYFKDRASAASSPCAMDAKLSSTINTGSFSTMNMDVVFISGGTYLVAAGHDQYCDVYETKGYSSERGDGPPDPTLSFRFNPVGRLRTVLGEGENFYQKCVRFDKSTGGRRLVTGGSDGHIRVWDVKNLVDDRNPEVERNAILEINAHTGVVEDIDISPDGRYLFSVGQDGKTVLWDVNTGRRVQELPFPSELAKGYKVRSVRCTNLGERSLVFVVAYNSIVKNSKSLSFLGLWGFHLEKHTFDMYQLKQSGKGEGISTLCVSSCGNFTGIGTLAGSVSIFDTHEMKPLLVKPQTHGIFVTAVEFLDREAHDIALVNKNGEKLKVPGAAADSRASLVSLSADQTVQLHCLPFEHPYNVSLFLLKLAILSLLLYYLIWCLA